jgi:uncharacterized protein (DUF2342 family)
MTRRLRRISRLTVDGLRPSSAAICRSELWMRSASARYREGAEGVVSMGSGTTALIGGAALSLPEAARPFRQRLPVRRLIPTIRAASRVL